MNVQTLRDRLLRKKSWKARAAAFSLVEVTLALGIMAFAFVSILGLVPIGLSNFRQTKNTSITSLIAAKVFADLQSTPFSYLINEGKDTDVDAWRFPTGGSTNDPTVRYVRYFDDQGQELTAYGPTAVYQVNVSVVKKTPFVQPSAGPAGSAASPNSTLAMVDIQVAFNPGNLTMDFKTVAQGGSSVQTLWSGTAGNGKIQVPVTNYPSLVARNF